MKHTSFLFVFLAAFSLFSQIEIKGNQGKPCYDKAAQKMRSKYIDSDCGKIAGVLDCNEKLEYEEQANMFFSKGSGQPYTGQCETCHPNGLLERRIKFTNGREDGIDTTYYYSGCPMVIREHTLGLENGRWRYYYDSTQQIAWERNYYRGIKQGVHVFFDNKGDTTVLENYANDLLNGVKKVYFTKNKVERVIYYTNGVFNGPYITYNMDGKKIQELNYKMGKKDGVLTFYYDDGTLLRTENWALGVKNGEFKTLYYNGSLQSIENYKKGIKEGIFEERYNNQKVKRRAFYKKGELIEEHIFDEYGKETYTFGAQPYPETEDDAVPEFPSNTKKEKKKK